MINITRATITFGIIMLIFSLINSFGTDIISGSSLLRANVLSALSSIIVVGLGFLLQKIEPNKQEKAKLLGDNGFTLQEDLKDNIKEELAWGSKYILKATAAATILIHFNGKTILRRGLVSKTEFVPGKICKSSLERGKMINLINTKNYPGSYEFDTIIKGLPSVLVYPLDLGGFVIVGGWTPRCFTRSDEIWISGWTERLLKKILIEEK